MPHEKGTYLGGMRTLADLRARCKVDECTGCWHLLKASGERFSPDGKRQGVHVHGHGSMTALRAAYLLSRGEEIPPDRVVYRKCTSYDCVAPLHILRGTRQMMCKAQGSRDRASTPAKTEAIRRSGLARSRLNEEIRQWILESPQSGVELGILLGVAHTHISELRAKARGSGRYAKKDTPQRASPGRILAPPSVRPSVRVRTECGVAHSAQGSTA